MYLTAKEAMTALNCSFEQLLVCVTAGNLQPYEGKGCAVGDAKIKANIIINPHHPDGDYFDHHLMVTQEEIGNDWYFREADCDRSVLLVKNKTQLTKNEQRAKVILDAIDELDYDRMSVMNKEQVKAKCKEIDSSLFAGDFVFDSAWKYGNRKKYWKIHGSKIKK
ncbi:hypothetical protein [uncultured Paraglaciecola sp.]|uniref:hypothetical protein n=1 Tax=uncultured Paraglaciecola sp. TaxID=1765024 RepID=UPI0025CB888C|nr:hypothetical protein [uncultured Paraglaciecola sp.]